MDKIELLLMIVILVAMYDMPSLFAGSTTGIGEDNYYIPPRALMSFNPQVVRPYDSVKGDGEININLFCVSYRIEYDVKARGPSNILYYNLPEKPFSIGPPKWVNEEGVYYYENGFTCSISYRRFVVFQTSTSYMYDYHWGAVGEVFWGVYSESYFVGENIR